MGYAKDSQSFRSRRISILGSGILQIYMSLTATQNWHTVIDDQKSNRYCNNCRIVIEIKFHYVLLEIHDPPLDSRLGVLNVISVGGSGRHLEGQTRGWETCGAARPDKAVRQWAFESDLRHQTDLWLVGFFFFYRIGPVVPFLFAIGERNHRRQSPVLRLWDMEARDHEELLPWRLMLMAGAAESKH